MNLENHLEYVTEKRSWVLVQEKRTCTYVHKGKISFNILLCCINNFQPLLLRRDYNTFKWEKKKGAYDAVIEICYMFL